MQSEIMEGQGGEVQMDYGKTFWAHRFGALVDRFGIPWMISCDSEHSASPFARQPGAYRISV